MSIQGSASGIQGLELKRHPGVVSIQGSASGIQGLELKRHPGVGRDPVEETAKSPAVILDRLPPPQHTAMNFLSPEC